MGYKVNSSYIEFDEGVYPMPVMGGIRNIKGQGEGITTLVCSGSGFKFVHSGSGYQSEFSVSDMTISGTGCGVEVSGNSVANRVNNIRVRNVCFEGLATGLKIHFGCNVFISNLKFISCGKGMWLHETADIKVSNVSTQLCSEFGTLLTGATLPYNEGFSATGLIDNGSKVGIKISHYDYVWLAACSFSSAKENAMIGEYVSNLSWESGEVSNTLGQGSGIVMDANCERWLLGKVLFDNITLFGIVVRGKDRDFSGLSFINVSNVPIYVEATDCEFRGLKFRNTGTSWVILEAGGANRNRYYCKPPAGKLITLVGAQSEQFN